MAELNTRFTAKLQKSPAKGGWTYLIWPGSVRSFGTKGLVKVRGTIGKDAGATVIVRLEERLNG